MILAKRISIAQQILLKQAAQRGQIPHAVAQENAPTGHLGMWTNPAGWVNPAGWRNPAGPQRSMLGAWDNSAGWTNPSGWTNGAQFQLAKLTPV